MGHEIQYLLETKRLVWLVALVFAVLMVLQYFEFPYGDVVSSLFSASKAQIVNVNGSYQLEASTQRPQIFEDITHSYALNASYDSNPTLEENVDGAFSPMAAVVLAPTKSPDIELPNTVNATLTDSTIVLEHETSKPDASKLFQDFKESQEKTIHSDDKASANEAHSMRDVVTISDMHDMLAQNRASSRSMIENAPINENDPALNPSLYVNISRFKRSYELMEKTLKVYIYNEGEKPIFHQPTAVLKGIYASEGWFMKHMKESQHFVTKNPKEAHLFYIPFSSRMLEVKLYVPDSHSHKNLEEYMKNFLDLIIGKYKFWNRTDGSDHFFVACHDWAPAITEKYMNSCIRAMCNSDIKKEGFELGKDVALPETLISSAKNPLRQFGGLPVSQRSNLAFFAGRMHGNLRQILLQHWQNKDPDMKIFGKLPKSKHNNVYIEYMKSSKYCICAKGYEVNSPRVVEAIFYECVPVIISDNFVPPFFEVLNWESFAVFVKEKDIPNLKNILLSISDSKYLVMQKRVKQVQQHFLWHVKPVKYDIFHMILHSIWYNKVFRINPR
ncbi:probable glycosyltransferase At3g07620 isoform X2 [Rutidosis leptorrhynchoides]|uniref:probable glycosyltransferase At3g07620 isoform X2 n=1 Tax=Rutidosis leptorrhynchoides TaxID=125765 RepID=UPI003A997C62